MRQGKVIETTLGDLIVSVTDEVRPYVSDSPTLYLMVSCVLTDLLARECCKRSGRKYSRRFAKTLH
jgi:hypothetical protein